MPTEKNKRTFVVLLGTSGVGKTSLIHRIIKRSNDFEYVKPYMTRPLRDGEKDKKSISDKEFIAMETNGDFLVVNEHFGYKYGTPKTTILDIFSKGKTPILDYQLSTIESLYDPAYELFCIYVRPDSIKEWEKRLISSGQYDKSRFQAGKVELEKVMTNNEIQHINYMIVNKNQEIDESVDDILDVTSKFMH